MSSLKELEARITVVEDIEAIKKLKARYCYSVDARNFDELLRCFAEDATVEIGPHGKFVGKQEYTRFFTKVFPADCSFTLHHVHDPLIEVNGEKATGKWYFEVPGTWVSTNEAVWIAGRYEEEYSKKQGEWKFSSIVAYFSYITPFDQGWVKKKMVI